MAGGALTRTIGRGGARQQAIEQRDEEGSGLAGPRLRLARHVAARKGDRQRLCLNWRRAGKA